MNVADPPRSGNDGVLLRDSGWFVIGWQGSLAIAIQGNAGLERKPATHPVVGPPNHTVQQGKKDTDECPKINAVREIYLFRFFFFSLPSFFGRPNLSAAPLGCVNNKADTARKEIA